jgi:hypothetical protein
MGEWSLEVARQIGTEVGNGCGGEFLFSRVRVQGRTENTCASLTFPHEHGTAITLSSPSLTSGRGGQGVRASSASQRRKPFHRPKVLSALKRVRERGAGGEGETARRQVTARGQALVEFTLVLGLFLLLILGLISVGQLLLANYAVNQAARAGAHQAAISGGAAAPARLAVEQVLNAGVGTSVSRANVTVACTTAPCRRYDPIRVEVVYHDAFWAPLPPLFTTFTVRAEATRASERDQQ